MNLYQKISAILKDVQYLSKDSTVGVGINAYKALSEEKVTTAVRESMIVHGVVIIPIERKFNRDDHWYTNQYGKETCSRFTTCETKYKIINIDDPKEFEIVSSGGAGVDSQDKGIGSAMTYDYKYLLLRMLAIPTGQDPDKVHNEQHEEEQKKGKTEEQLKKEAEEAMNKKAVEGLRKSIITKIKLVNGMEAKPDGYNTPAESKATHKKHLGVDSVLKCVDTAKLDEYLQHLTDLTR